MSGATDVEVQEGEDRPAVDHRLSWVRWVLARPLWVHVLALGLVLVALVPVVGLEATFLPDEGAAVLQAELVDQGTWTAPHPYPEVDPDGESHPIRNALEGEQGWAPLAKHPIWAWSLGQQPFGVPGMVLLSVLGTVVAAAMAALLARRVDPRTDRAVLWTVGLASPLLFDGFLLMAHATGAALVGIAAVLAVRATERRAVAALLVIPPALLAVTLRNEVALLAVASALILAVSLVRRRSWAVAAVLGSIVVALVAGRLFDAWLTTTVVPGATHEVVKAGAGQADLLGSRLQATLITTVLPGYAAGLGALLLVVALLCVVVGALRARAADPAVAIWWSVAAVLYAARLLLEPGPVPGLLVAFPVLVAGLVVLHRHTLVGPAPALLAVSATFALAVAATQYAKGGTGEWGARYVAVAVPLVVPVAVASLAAARDDVSARSRPAARRAIGALVVASVATSVLAVLALHHLHARTAELTDAVVDQAQGTEATPDGGAPVVVTTVAALPRLAWEQADELRWLLADDDELTPLLERLDEQGVTEVVLVTRGADDAGLGLGPYQTVQLDERAGGWDLRTLRAVDASTVLLDRITDRWRTGVRRL